MDKIHEIAGDGARMPRFDDGMVNMAELIRVMAESLVNEIMDAQADEACEAGNQRNGCRERRLTTSVGTVNLRIPKPRAGSYFPEDLIGRYSRTDRAVIAAVPEMVTNGVPTRKAERVAQSMGTDRMSASQVSRMCSSLDDAVADLRARGVSGAICVTSDAHEGLKRAIQEVFPGAAWQRRIVRLMRNAAGNAATRRKRGAVLGILKAVFAERDPELVRELYHLAIEQIGSFCPKAAELLEDAEADALAYLDFPHERHVGLRTNNVQERANRELKRRSRVVRVLPSSKSLIRMMGAVFAEMDEEWAGRRWFKDDSIGRAVEGAKANAPAPTYEGAAAEHAARIIALVVADNPIPGRKAA